MVVISKEIKEKIINNYYFYILFTNLRAYSIYFLNRISNYKIEKRKFYKVLGYKVNLEKPESFNEKIIWKKIHDRNPLLSITADKYEVRSYIKDVLGEETAKEILIPLLYATNKPKTIPFENLAVPFIIKPNHYSGRYIIVIRGGYDKKEIIRTCYKWLKTPFGLEKLEWAYQPIKRKIVIEKLLQEEDGNTPVEFKFDMFHSKCARIRVVLIRMNNRFNFIYDREWNLIAKRSADPSPNLKVEKPKNYEMMIEIAEKLSAPFDHVRVDFYNIDGKIFFSELTHYSKSGLIKQIKLDLSDYKLGQYWKIKPKYWEIDKI